MKVTTDACLFGAWVAEEMQNAKGKMKNILDIGSGTGLLSLMVAQKNNSRIDAVEIDRYAAEEANENIQNAPWKEQITIHHLNILEFHPDHLYDAIICNPPFYENEWTSDNSRKNTSHHSQHLNLKEVLDVIKKHLSEQGIYYLLLPAKRETKLKFMLEEMGLHIHKLVTVSLSPSNKRIMISGSKQSIRQIETGQITVNDERFKTLLKDYYLYA